MFLFIIHIWWRDYRLQVVPVLHFGIDLFLVSFCLFVMLCALRSTGMAAARIIPTHAGAGSAARQAIGNFLVANHRQI